MLLKISQSASLLRITFPVRARTSTVPVAESALRAIILSLATSGEPAQIGPLRVGTHEPQVLLPEIPLQARTLLEALRVVLMHGRPSLPIASIVSKEVLSLVRTLTDTRRRVLCHLIDEMLADL